MSATLAQLASPSLLKQHLASFDMVELEKCVAGTALDDAPQEVLAQIASLADEPLGLEFGESLRLLAAATKQRLCKKVAADICARAKEEAIRGADLLQLLNTDVVFSRVGNAGGWNHELWGALVSILTASGLVVTHPHSAEIDPCSFSWNAALPRRNINVCWSK